MSSGIKRPHQQAVKDALAFRDLFQGCYERWEIAGSVRRGKPDVGDVEHCVIPKWDNVAGDDLFATPKMTNFLLRRCDELAMAGHPLFSRHVYGTNAHGAPMHRWGDLLRGCDFNGFNHELFSADADNWGSKFAILTGPADFSTMLVSKLRPRGYRNHKGRVWRCEHCPQIDHHIQLGLPRCPDECDQCQGTGLVPVEAVAVKEEPDFFDLAGVGWVRPEERK